MTIKEALDYGINNLSINDKFIKVRMLLSYLLNVDNNYLITHDTQSLSIQEEDDFKIAIEKLSMNVPIQYITGVQEFFGLEFNVNKNVLIPRFDTEVLVEEVLRVAKKRTQNPRYVHR